VTMYWMGDKIISSSYLYGVWYLWD